MKTTINEFGILCYFQQYFIYIIVAVSFWWKKLEYPE